MLSLEEHWLWRCIHDYDFADGGVYSFVALYIQSTDCIHAHVFNTVAIGLVPVPGRRH